MWTIETHALLVGMQNDTWALEKHLAVIYKVKHTLTILPYNPTLGISP
jgi:hypothetical protein